MLRTVLAAIVFLGVTASPTSYAWRAPMIYDTNWGADVPLLDPAGVELPIGFVHLPLSGGYLFLTVQTIDDSGFVVATRFRADGTLDTDWLDPAVDPFAMKGSAILDAPLPDLDDKLAVKARIAIDKQGTQERIYLAEVIGTGTSVAVSRFDPNLDNVDIGVALPVGLHNEFGNIEAVVAGVPVGSANTGLVVAVNGNGTEASTSILFGAAGTSFSVKRLADHTGSDFRINFIAARSDGDIDVVGTEDDTAVYMLAKTQPTASIANLNELALSCPDGSLAMSSTFDTLIAAPSITSGDESLVTGRADCGAGGFVSMVERISAIGSGTLARVTAASQIGTNTNCADTFPLAQCISYLATTDGKSNTAIATTPDGFLAHIDANAGRASLDGDEVNAAAFGYPTVAPTYAFGASLEYPYAVSISFSSAQISGIRRIAVDRIFADGGGEFGP